MPVFVHQVSKKYVSKELAKEIHAKAAPFVKWLKEAEEESEGSEEEEEEEDENVEVSDRCRSFWFTDFSLILHGLNWLLSRSSVLVRFHINFVCTLFRQQFSIRSKNCHNHSLMGQMLHYSCCRI